MYDEPHFTRDAATVSFDESADGITVDEDDVSIDWNEVETVRIDDPPHADAFDSKEFHKLPATVARPIPQPYQYGEDAVWLKKPRDALKKAAWSLDNASWTMGHPETGMVKDVDDVRGFWRNPRYIDSHDDLDADLHIPVDDAEAKEYVEENGDVSVGFYNRIARTDEYDGVVGGSDAEDVEVEGYQTNMLFDHVASVGTGRCPSEKGCGLDSATDSMDGHGHVTVVDTDAFKSGTRITDKDEDETEPDMCNDCGGCGADETETEDTNTMEIEFDDLSTEAAFARLTSEHDGASDRLDELREAEDKAEVAEDAADELELDDVEDLDDKVALLKEKKQKLEERVDELQRPQMEEDASFIAEHTDRFGEDADEVIDNLDDDPEAVADKRELVEELAEGYEETTANADSGEGETETESTSSGKYAKSPWE